MSDQLRDRIKRTFMLEVAEPFKAAIREEITTTRKALAKTPVSVKTRLEVEAMLSVAEEFLAHLEKFK